MADSILLTGGGTGGHVYPNVAVAQAMRGRNPAIRVHYCGRSGGIEETIASRNDFDFRSVLAAPFPGLRKPLHLLKFLLILGIGTLQASIHLIRTRPATLVATGGYVAAPCVFAAVGMRFLRILRIRIFVHEQNASPGKLNRLVARFADVVGLSFAGMEGQLPPGAPVRYVGYPVRPSLREEAGKPGGAPNMELPESLKGIPEGRTVLLAFGGSTGARTINRAVVDALPVLSRREDIFVLHGIGEGRASGYDPAGDVDGRIEGLELAQPLERFYRRLPYLHDMGAVYAAASLVVSRAGAGTVKELCCVGKPSILIPKAGLAGDHQVMNALVLEQGGAAVVLHEYPVPSPEGLLPAVEGRDLARQIITLLDAPERLRSMGAAADALDDTNATDRILAALEPATPPPEAGASSGHSVTSPELALAELGAGQLLQHVARARRSAGTGCQLPSQAYLRYRCASLLAADGWQARNCGVKIAGLLGSTQLLPLLMALWNDPRPAGLIARLAGGDRIQNGFIRRNLVHSITQISSVDARVESAIEEAMRDRYFEVRREACHAIDQLPALARQDWAGEALVRALDDRSFEVRIAAVKGLSRSHGHLRGVPLLRRFYMDANWQLRHAVLEAFERWGHQGDECTRGLLRTEMDGILLTADGYKPSFGLKEKVNAVRGALATSEVPGPAPEGETRQ